MNPETINEQKHFSKSYIAVFVAAVVVLAGLLVYKYIKNHPPLTTEQKNIKMLYESIPKNSQPNEADIQSLYNSIPKAPEPAPAPIEKSTTTKKTTNK